MRTRMRRGMAAALTVSALFTAAACGGSGDDKKPAAGQEQSKDKDKDKSKDAEAPVTTPLTAAQLKAATLELKDLPAGWKADNTPADNTPAPTADKPECQPLAVLLADKFKNATMGEGADFKGKSDGIALGQDVFTFDGNGAADFTKAIGTALDNCTKLSFTEGGEKVDLTVEKLSAPKVAEESHTFRMTMSMPEVGFELKISMLVARQGAGVTRIAYLPGEDPAAEKAFDDLVTRTGAKLVKGAQS